MPERIVMTGMRSAGMAAHRVASKSLTTYVLDIQAHARFSLCVGMGLKRPLLSNVMTGIRGLMMDVILHVT